MITYDPAVVMHASGDHHSALQERLTRLEAMSPSDPSRAGLLGTIALNYERTGDHDQAVTRADEAIRVLDGYNTAEQPAADIFAAQKSSTFLNTGIVYLRAAARARLQRESPHLTEHYHSEATYCLKRAEEGINAQRQGWRPHQHAINASSRLAMLEATKGWRFYAVRRSVGAIIMGPMSESRLATHTSGLQWRDQMRAAAKATARGVAAFGVAALATLPGTVRMRRHTSAACNRIIAKAA